jgi:hypothetical protein
MTHRVSFFFATLCCCFVCFFCVLQVKALVVENTFMSVEDMVGQVSGRRTGLLVGKHDRWPLQTANTIDCHISACYASGVLVVFCSSVTAIHVAAGLFCASLPQSFLLDGVCGSAGHEVNRAAPCMDWWCC